MRSELQIVLDSVKVIPAEQLPELLGQLEVIRTTALFRLAAPPVPPAHEELLSIEMAAERLAMSKDYLYRNADKLPFTRRVGRNLRFSSLGIDRYITHGKLK